VVRLWIVVLACAVAAAGGASAVRAGGSVEGRAEVAIFYYGWWGTPARDGGWGHWGQREARPPKGIASSFYPARGPYSSADPAVVRAQMREIAGAGIDSVVVSWWGPGSVEDLRLPLITREATAHGLRVAIHIEPWRGRTPAEVAREISRFLREGVTDFYVYDSTLEADAAWAAALAGFSGARIFANTPFPGKAQAGGFTGLYTYDVYVYNGDSFARVCSSARRLGLLCAPSVGPGYNARQATGDQRARSRRQGGRYDAMWLRAIRARTDIVTITSYNEWHEGTQIEAARAIGPPYLSYEGAYGRRGRAAERAYLDRTAYWIARLRAQ
jgi:glycoprotein endo-alpha-1,2-mannosidase